VLGAVQERTFELVPQGEWVFTLSEIEESSGGQYGDALIWKFYLSKAETPTDYILKANHDELTHWEYTDVDVNLGSKQHEWAQLLSGRTLAKGDAPPDDGELYGRSFRAYLTHKTLTRGKNAGSKKERIVEGSAQPFRVTAEAIMHGPQVAQEKPATAEPVDDSERGTAMSAIERELRKAEVLGIDVRATRAMDLSLLSVGELMDALKAIRTAIAEA